MKTKIIEIQKELMKLKTMSKFSHYEYGELFYTVCLVDSVPGTYQFPISVIEMCILSEIIKEKVYTKTTETTGPFEPTSLVYSHDFKVSFKPSYNLISGIYLESEIKSMDDRYALGQMDKDPSETKLVKLSSDLGTTSFGDEVRGSELFRWIKKAIENDEFIKL